MSLTLKPSPYSCFSSSVRVGELHMVFSLHHKSKTSKNLTFEAFFHICNSKNLTPYQRGRRFEGTEVCGEVEESKGSNIW